MNLRLISSNSRLHLFSIAVLVLLQTFCYAASSLAAPIQSPNDPRAYESLRLDNGLQVLLISDPDTDKAAAALDVNVGSSSDPKGREGLAHFLEHMLFLGTEKYPQAGEYQEYIAAHGGGHNAYTAFENTNYFFDVDKDYLEPALDRFAQFFTKPLFSREYVDREMHAVDSEYQSKRMQDSWRSFQAFKQAVNPEHPMAQFATGSLETLANREDSNTRDELIAFYDQHYSANIMTLVVLGKEPVAKLKEWVTEKFSRIENRRASALEIGQPLFTSGQLPIQLNIEPNKNQRSMSLTFPIPSVKQYYLSKPTRYIGNLLGHEGKGSLLSFLKERGWSDGLSAGTGMTTDNESTFNVTIKLTKDGLEHVDDISSHVFQYLRLVRSEGIAEWLFGEQRQLSDIAFQFQEEAEPIHYVQSLASSLHEYPSTDVLRGPYVMENYDPVLINRFLGYLTPNNVLITVIAKGLETDSTTSWFDTRYRIAAVPTETVERWREGEINVALTIPEPNIFLPDDLTVKPVQQTVGKPELVKRDPRIAVWHQQDDTYRVPRADFYFSIRSPVANDSPEHAVLTELYVELINDQLTEYSYPARLAGLDYRLYKHIRGFTVRISGYDSKQGLLLSRIAETLREPVLLPERFELFKDEMRRALRDAAKDTPYTQALTEVRTLLVNPTWSDEQLLTALTSLEFEDLTRFVPRLLRKTQVLALSHGNVSETEALQLAKVLERAVLDTTTPTSVPHGQVVKLTDNERYVRQLDIDHGDSAIAIYFQGSDTSFADRARFGLLAQILSSPFFQDLRTEKQLGYVVHASALPLFEVPGIVFLVQSPITDPVELEKHVQRFVVEYADNIAEMPDAVFERHKSALLTHILEREKSLSERSNRYWSELDEEHYGFDSREQLAVAVEAMSKEEFRDFYSKLFLDENRARLVVRSFGSKQKVTAAHDEHDGGDTLIQDPQTFKEDKEFFSSFVDPARSLMSATRALARGERVSEYYSDQAR